MKRRAGPLVGAPAVAASAVSAEGTPFSPQVADPSHTESVREPQGLAGAVAQALGPAVARGLGFDLRAAIRARHVRLLAVHALDGRPLPSNWAIPILPARWWWCARL